MQNKQTCCTELGESVHRPFRMGIGSNAPGVLFAICPAEQEPFFSTAYELIRFISSVPPLLVPGDILHRLTRVFRSDHQQVDAGRDPSDVCPFVGLTSHSRHAIKARFVPGPARDRFCPPSQNGPGANLIRRGQTQHSLFLSCSGSVFGNSGNALDPVAIQKPPEQLGTPA